MDASHTRAWQKYLSRFWADNRNQQTEKTVQCGWRNVLFFLSTSSACFSSDASSFVSVLSPTGPSLLWPMAQCPFSSFRHGWIQRENVNIHGNEIPLQQNLNLITTVFFLSIFPLPGCFWLFLACILVLCLWKKIQSFTCFGPGGRQQLSRPTLHTHTTHTIARCARCFHTNSTLLP